MPQAACLGRLRPWVTFALVPTIHTAFPGLNLGLSTSSPESLELSMSFDIRCVPGARFASEVCGSLSLTPLLTHL